MNELDHFLWGVSDLEKGVEELQARSGVRARPGGVHPGMGTRNALVGMGGTYLEVIAPDPAQPAAGLAAELAALPAPRLHTFAVRSGDIEGVAPRLEPLGIRTQVVEMSRERRDATPLRWRIALLLGHELGGCVPFLIDWQDSPHPAAELPAELRLVELALEHPRPDALSQVLGALGLELQVSPAPEPGLRLRLRGPRGRLELGS